MVGLSALNATMPSAALARNPKTGALSDIGGVKFAI
jgi:hypothetical protein